MAKNLLNELIYVDFKEVSSIQLKQGDTSPILIKLINNAGVKSYKSLKEYAAESSSQRATVYLSTSKNTVVFKQSFEVKNGAVALTINQVLPVGTYFLEILYDGKVYPSVNSLSVRINPSADIAQEDIISLETIEAIESNILSKVLPQVQEQIDALLSNQVQKYLAENGHTLRGERGETGARGLTGERGADGTSVTITKTETLSNGDKKITFSTGETITIPKGNKGEDGTSLTINNVDNDSDPSNVKITFSDNTVISIPKGINGERGERGIQGVAGNDGKSIGIKNVEEATVTTGGWGWFGGGTTTKVMRITFTDGKTADIPHGLQGERGEKGEPFKFEDFTSEQLKQLSPIADTGWLPVSLQNGFFNENESTSKLSYRIIRDESIGIINISGRIKTPNTLTRGLKYIASIPIKNDKVTALTAYASNYSGVSQTPTFSMFYENKTLTINTVTEIPANTVFDINGTTIVNLT
ncbi:hypothetical protein O0H36_01870 [Staphylococcus pseudintermedius]|nr:hypothetical protein [Staphylococcus pseudintermedius]